MKKFVSKVSNKLTTKALEAQALLRRKDGENFVDTAIKILMAVVIGALVLGFYNGMTALAAGLILLLLFHALCFIIQKLRGRTVPRAYPLAPFLSIGCLAAYFLF